MSLCPRRRRQTRPSQLVRTAALVLVAALACAVVPAAGAATVDGHLSGLVEDASGHPLANAAVSLTDPASGVAVAAVTADGQGRYHADVPIGSYSVDVAGSGTSGLAAHVAAVTVGGDSHVDFVPTGPPTTLVTFEGRLRDSAGQPIALATLDVGNGTVTDPDGRFLIQLRPNSYSFDLILPPADGAVHLSIAGFDLTHDRTVDWTIPVSSVDVAVHNETGTALPYSEATLVVPDRNCSWCPSTTTLFPGGPKGFWMSGAQTGEDGHAHFFAIAADAAVLSAQTDGYPSPPRRTGVQVVAPSTTLDFTVPTATSTTTPPPPPLHLTGQVTDFDGTPSNDDIALTAAPGQWNSLASTIADNGAYTLAAPSAGSYSLSIQGDRGPGDDFNPDNDSFTLWVGPAAVDHDGQVLDVRIPGGLTTIRVLGTDGQPVAGATVTSQASTSDGPPSGEPFPGGTWSGSTTSDHPTNSDGIAVIRTLPGTATNVHVAPPSDRGIPADVTIPADTASMDIHLQPGVTVRGTLSDTAGQPVHPVHFQLVSADGHTTVAITPAADGSFVAAVAPGQYRLSIDSYPDVEGESEDRSGWTVTSDLMTLTADTQLSLTMPEPATGGIDFVDGEGLPVSGNAGFIATSAPDAINLTPDLHATTGGGASYMGEVDGAGGPFVGPSTVSGTFAPDSPDNDPSISYANLPLTADGDIIIAAPPGIEPHKPDPPANVTATQTGPTSATVTWEPPATTNGAPIVGYLVFINGIRDTFPRYWAPATATGTAITAIQTNPEPSVAVIAVTTRGLGLFGSYVAITDGAAPSRSGPDPTPVTPTAPDPTAQPSGTAAAHPTGYWALGSDGQVYNFGDAAALGNASSGAVDLEPTPTGKGYWILNRNGTVQAFGDGTPLGDVDMSKLAKGEEPASLSATPTGKGYWVFTNRGRVLAFGDAPFLGDMSQTKLNGPVLGSVATPSGRGYYMVASDGGIFAFGDATFAGSMGGKKLNAPVQSLVPDGDGHGYWLVASDGGIFAFDAPFRGSMGATRLNKPVVGMVRYGDGYLMVGADGGIFNFSTGPFSGSLSDRPPAAPVVAVAAVPN